MNVMLDRDLAVLYNVETKRLKEVVRRNINRFPEDFIFEMSSEELAEWRSHFATSNSNDLKMGLRYAPMCFTEQGVAMLSSVLNTKLAISVNIQIVRIFTKIRQAMMDVSELRTEVEKIKRQLSKYDQSFDVVFRYLEQLINKPNPPRKMTGYKPVVGSD